MEPRLSISCQTLVSCASRPDSKLSETAARSSIASWPAWLAVRAEMSVDLAEAEAQDVEVVDGVLDQAAAAGLLDVGAPLRPVGALDREVLVVAEDGRHRLAQGAALDDVAQGPEHRRAAQDEPALAGDPGGVDRVDERSGAGEVTVEGLLAENGAAGGEGGVDGGAVRRGRRAHEDGVGTGGDLFGAGDGRRSRAG